jgi:hypothetical protein
MEQPRRRQVNAKTGLLDALHAALTRYVILPSPEAADAVVLWIAATHGQAAWEHATRLAIISPEKRCGKSRLLDLVEATVAAPLITVNVSPAALVRSIGDHPPTLLIDEADTIFGAKAKDANEDLRGILNAGHQRNRPYLRWDAGARRREECPTFAMAGLAAIGDLPGTIMDRAVIVKMRRRAPGEVVAPYRQRRDAPQLHQIRDQLAAWVRAHLAGLRDAVPVLPVEDRAADTWESLVAVADLAGGTWPDRARRACKLLVAAAEVDDSEASLSLRLLSDIRDVFTWADFPHALFGDVLLARLRDIEAAPWGEFFGHQLTARELARMLRPYGVRPREVKISGQHRKGYRHDELADTWARYLPSLAGTPSATSATSATCQLSMVADEEPHPRPPRPADRTGRGGRGNGQPSATGLACEVAEVAEVADTPPSAGPLSPTTPSSPHRQTGRHTP